MRATATLAFFWISCLICAQHNDHPSYSLPIDIPIFLSGTFGELRSSNIDLIKEKQKEREKLEKDLDKLKDNFKKHELKKYEWQKPHKPNLTGTKSAYYPNKNKDAIEKKYKSWKN